MTTASSIRLVKLTARVSTATARANLLVITIHLRHHRIASSLEIASPAGHPTIHTKTSVVIAPTVASVLVVVDRVLPTVGLAPVMTAFAATIMTGIAITIGTPITAQAMIAVGATPLSVMATMAETVAQRSMAARAATIARITARSIGPTASAMPMRTRTTASTQCHAPVVVRARLSTTLASRAA